MNKFFLIISGLILFLNAALSQTVAEINLCNGIQAPALSEPEDHPNSGGQRPYIVKHTWFSSDDNVTYSPITGANSPAYQPPVLTSIKYYKLRYTYYNYVADPRYLYLYSKTYIITTYAPVASGVVSGEQTNCYNSVPTQLSATAATGGDGNFTYQWQYSTDNVNWFDISGANQLNYPPSNLTITTRYRIRSHSTAGCGDVYSNAVTVTVFDPLTIGNISGNQSICYSSSASPLNGSVASGGFGPFTYRWQYSSDNSSWSDIATADQMSYTPVNVRQNTYYRMGAQGNFCGNIYSNSVVVNVYPEVQGGTIGNAQTICYGSSPNNLVGTPGSGGYGLYSYTWYYSYDNNNFYEILNSNNKDFQPGSLTKSTYYKRMTADNCGLEYTANLLISVNAELKGTSISGDQSICTGAIINTLVGENPTGGDGGYSYKWQKSTDKANWNDIVNSNSKDYQPFNVTQTTYFRRITFTNSCGSATSNVVSVSVKEAATPGTIGSDQTICYNTKPSALVNTNSPTGTYTVKWQSFNNSSWSDITGVVDLSFSPNELISTTKYRRVITDVCSSVNSNEVVITVLPAVNPGVIASDQTICYKAMANSMVGGSASGSDGSFTYKWQRSADKVNWEDLFGTNALSYYPGSLEKTTSYRRIAISGRCGETSSNVVTISVNPELKNTNIAADQEVCFGASINSLMGESPTGGDGSYTYKWHQSADNSNWSEIVNSTNKDFQPVNVTKTSYFKRITFTNTCGSAVSNVVKISVTPELVPGVISATQIICEGTRPAELTGTVATGAENIKYHWESSISGEYWEKVSGANDLNYQPDALIASKYFRRVATSTCGSKNTNSVYVTILAKPAAPSIATKPMYCKDQDVTLSPSNNAFSYEWYDQLGSVIKTGNTLTISKIASSQTIAVKAINSNNCKSDLQSIVLNVDHVKAGFSANAFAITKGDFVQFSSSSTNAALYLWNFFEGENSTKEGPLKYYYSPGPKNVKLTVTSQSGCKDSVTMVNYITVTGATSVEGLLQKGFSIYPNPVLESLTVESETTGPFVISLTNLEGKILMVKEGFFLDKLVLDCSTLPQGVYVLKIGQERGEVTFKVIKQ